ncbi:hypothetical protein RE428_11380 [Marinobacter nanhaiticus D15-8W]|nr:SpoIIE family protein phosphatase [Marinobacter nanhaiticus]BES70120.1 hypothetical protein RE428_11380 [Marinobacter nanhaiticus D15-8W]
MTLHLDYALATQSHIDEDADVCGDTGLIKNTDEGVFLALIDGLGHGPDADEIARQARSYLEHAYRKASLVDIIQGLHQSLRRTKGAVVALCRINTSSGELNYAGVGNISAKLYAPNPITFVPREGIVGDVMSSPREETLILSPGMVLILHSDGLPAHKDFSGALSSERSAQAIAEGLLFEYGKDDDDVSCIVVKVD